MGLARDDRGPEVLALQGMLQRVAWPGLVLNGEFDLETELTVRHFQRAELLTPDGLVGPITQQHLEYPTQKNLLEGSPVGQLLRAPWYSQRDNRNVPSGTCNVTCLAMALAYLGCPRRKQQEQFEDELYEFLHTPEADGVFQRIAPDLYRRVGVQNVHSMLVWAAQQYGATGSKGGPLSLDRVGAQLREGHPVLLSGRFTGSGHLVLAVGTSEDGQNLIVHDPWGDWNRGYRSRQGDFRVYTRRALGRVLKPTDSPLKYGAVISR